MRKLQRGKKYRVTTRTTKFVGVYLGFSTISDKLQFSLRPAFGTSEVDESQIKSAEMVSDSTECGLIKDR